MVYGGDGGVYCFDAENIAQPPVEWTSAADITPFLRKASRHVNTIEVDRLGTVVYVGTHGGSWSDGNDSVDSSLATGTVIRFDGPFNAGVVPQAVALANEDKGNGPAIDFPFGFSVPQFEAPAQADGRPNQRYTSIRSIAIDPNNPYRFFAGMGAETSEYMGNMHANNGVWLYDGRLVEPSLRWTHVFGDPASSSRGFNKPVMVVAMNPEGLTSLNDGMGELLIGTDGQGPFRLDVTIASRPLISSTAEYPIRPSQEESTSVIAVAVTDPLGSGIAEVKLDARAIADSTYGAIALLDDGQGDDARAGDGIYTSAPIPTVVPTGGGASFSLGIFARANDGGYADGSLSVTVASSKSSFTDVSSSTGDLFTLSTADPYAATYFSIGTNGHPHSRTKGLVVTFDDATTPPLFLGQDYTASNRAPSFGERMGTWQSLSGPLPAGSRGVCYADVDNDGDQDLFICQNGANSVLYLNVADTADSNNVPTFVDSTAAFFGPEASALTGAHAAAWGDYNGDGFVDLFVATIQYSNSVKTIGDATISGYTTRIFRNMGGHGFQENIFGRLVGTSNFCLSGTWVDLDRNGDLDLVAAEFVGPRLLVFENTGYEAAIGDNRVAPTTAWLSDQMIFGATAVNVFDYDHDEFPDLIVTTEVDQGGALILRNTGDRATGFTVVTTLGVGHHWSGAVVADFDLNGQQDIVLLPVDGQPGMFMGFGTGISGQTPTYVDMSLPLGLRAGGVGAGTSGGLAADFNNDHDYDLYLGRVKSDPFLYKNARPGGADGLDGTEKWLEVKLATVGNSNESLIGAEVVVTSGSQRWTRIVDGGSGRGGQGSNQMLFGLGNLLTAADLVDVSVNFPSGGSAFAFAEPLNGIVPLIEDSPVVLKADSRADPNPMFSYELIPGGADWLFSWKTEEIKGDLRQDRVHIENNNNYLDRAPCYLGIAYNAPIDLVWGMADVTMNVYRDELYWQHVVRWANRPCVSNAGCSHRFTVTSGLVNVNSVTSGPKTTEFVDFCVPDRPFIRR